MATGVNILCYKSKTLANGEHPLMIRICKDGKKKYIGLGVSVLPQFWDFDKNKPKRNCPNKIAIEKLIATKTTEYNSLIVDMTADQKEYTPQSLVQNIEHRVQSRTVGEMYNKLMDDLRNAGQLGNLSIYKYSRDSLLKYTRNRLDIPFADIDSAWLKKYEDWLRGRGIKDTTISLLFRTLRSAFNKAIEQGATKRDNYPFDKFKLSHYDLSTQKRAITKEDIHKILDLDLSDERFYIQLARDLFLFSYFGAGINFSDMALLKFSNLKDGRVHYIRKKTKKPISFPLSEISQEIINKYASPFWSDEDYIFPILHAQIHKTEQQRRNRIQNA